MNNSIFGFIVGFLIASFIGFVILLNSYLPGPPRVSPRSELPKGLKAFLLSCPKAIFKHRGTFRQARKAQIDGDIRTAKKLYRQLLKVYPENKVIKYNLSLMK